MKRKESPAVSISIYVLQADKEKLQVLAKADKRTLSYIANDILNASLDLPLMQAKLRACASKQLEKDPTNAAARAVLNSFEPQSQPQPQVQVQAEPAFEPEPETEQSEQPTFDLSFLVPPGARPDQHIVSRPAAYAPPEPVAAAEPTPVPAPALAPVPAPTTEDELADLGDGSRAKGILGDLIKGERS